LKGNNEKYDSENLLVYVKEFDNYSLTNDEYNALAWIGLVGTDAWNSLNQPERNVLGVDYQTAINNVSSACD